MQNNNIVTIGRREDAKNNFYATLSSLLLFTIFLVLDVIFYVRDKKTWQLVILIISAVLAGFSLIGTLFTVSNVRYAKKVFDTPLISYNEDTKVFIVNDFSFHKLIEISKDDAIEVKISDRGDTYFWYYKNGKKTSTFIGYSPKGGEEVINNDIQRYKNM